MIRLEHADRRALLAVARALGRMVRSAGAEDVAVALTDAVEELGGTVVAATEAGPEALPFDLSCGAGPPVLPVAAPGSRARVRLEHVLPGLLEDARVAIARGTHDTRLAELVQVDWLTGLLNRRATERLVARLGPSDTLAVLDLDHFKQVNDLHGHAAGDEVLSAFAGLLRERARVEDRYGRLGGEEFVGVFPGMSVPEVVTALERIRADWREVAPWSVTFSAGVAAVSAGGGDQALEAADAALYEAKDAGRDTTRVAAEQEVTELVAPPSHRPAHAPLESVVLPRLLDHLSSGDVRAATDLALNLLDSGVALEEVVTRLLVPAQLEVGRRWQTSSWSVAEEHVATSVIDAVLAAATFRAGRTPEPQQGRQPVLVVCPEGEWHQLPSRMFSALLAEAGIPVVQLGPSLPARDLQRVLAGRRYDAVVLSCTLLSSLTAGARVIAAAHDNGVPVLAGGHALGADGRRALALGADGWADGPETAAGVLEGWWDSPPVLASPSVVVIDEPLAAALGPRALHRVVDRLRQREPRLVPEAPGALAATYEDLGHILRHVDAALAVDDPGLLLEFSQWLVSVLVCRALPAEAVPAAYEELEHALGTRHPRAVVLLRETRHALAEQLVDR